jgi:hypothetical protein
MRLWGCSDPVAGLLGEEANMTAPGSEQGVQPAAGWGRLEETDGWSWEGPR